MAEYKERQKKLALAKEMILSQMHSSGLSNDNMGGHGDVPRHAQGHDNALTQHDVQRQHVAQGHEYEAVFLDIRDEDIQLNNNVAYSCVTIPKVHLLPK